MKNITLNCFDVFTKIECLKVNKKIKLFRKNSLKKLFNLWKFLLDKKNFKDELGEKRVLISDCEKIGNYIFKTPMIKGLTKNGYKVSVLGSSVTKTLIEGNPDVHKFIDSKCYRKKSSDIYKKIYLALKYRKSFDLYIEMTGSIYLREILFIRLLNCKKNIGIPRKNKKNLNMLESIPFKHEHHIDNGLEVLKILGIKGKRSYCIPLKGDEKYSDLKSDDLIVLYNGNASNKSRSILKKQEDELINFLSLKKGVHLIKIQMEKSLLDLASLIKNSDLVISVDTGIVHMASSFNKPIIINSSNNSVFPISKTVFLSDFKKEKIEMIIDKHFLV